MGVSTLSGEPKTTTCRGLLAGGATEALSLNVRTCRQKGQTVATRRATEASAALAAD